MPSVGGSAGAGPWAGGRRRRQRASQPATAPTAARRDGWIERRAHRRHRRTNRRGRCRRRRTGRRDERHAHAPGIMAAVRPRVDPRHLLHIGEAPGPGARGLRRGPGCRAPPGARRSPTAIFAARSSALAIIGVVARRCARRQRRRRRRSSSTSLYPPIAVTEQGAEIRDLYTIVFLIAVGDLPPRRRADRLDGHPLPAQAQRRRPAAADPRQQHRRARLDGRPDASSSSFLFVVSWQTLNAVDTRRPPSRRPRSARSPASSSGQFDYLPADYDRAGQGRLHRCYAVRADRHGRRHVRPGRPDGPALPDAARTSSTPSTSRSSCSSATSCRAGSTSSTSRSTTTDAGQTFRGQCAELCGTGHSDHAVRRPRADRRRLRRLAGRQDRSGERHAAAAPAAPSASGGAGGAPGAGTDRSRSRAKNVAFTTDRARARPADSADHDRVRQQGRRRRRTTSRSSRTRSAATVVFEGEIFPGVATEDLRRPAARRRAPTPSSAPSIRT